MWKMSLLESLVAEGYKFKSHRLLHKSSMSHMVSQVHSLSLMYERLNCKSDKYVGVMRKQIQYQNVEILKLLKDHKQMKTKIVCERCSNHIWLTDAKYVRISYEDWYIKRFICALSRLISMFLFE